MRQDLDINIIGTLGDKVSVDVAQFSGVQSPLTNRIGLRFAGEDDEVLRKLDLGNTTSACPAPVRLLQRPQRRPLRIHAQGRLAAPT